MQGTETYTYGPLLLEPPEIRLLILHAGSRDEPIQCTLFNVELPDADYQALSYEWGLPDDTIDGRVIINGLPHARPMQTNLGLALLGIREETHDRILWIDALCINQEDLREKGQHVAMMGDIFRNATSVIVWLGPEADNSHLAMRMMASRTWTTSASTDLERECRMEALVALAHRRYWRRVWVIQEFHLARRYELRCGADVVCQESFEDCMIWGLDALGGGMKTSPAHAHRLARDISQAPELCKLSRWLRMCFQSGFEASNQRDYVYALIGISYDCRDGVVVPEYSGTVRDTFLQAAPFFHTYPSGQNPTLLARDGQRLAEKMGLVFDGDLRRAFLERDSL
ncbi:hypothetical protein NEMBOFW57_008557 [Staphylotrichum longicolle]|uniref:Heterokaryon incompatibility domain-containing protein n=1 Tax=Staphylotrichum longicolle TaxID=669026 RepID=A0AAD4ES82_9PEZI|nr:hypothetical protein NEMBOFW57_008557 [Staphylotrichum longicolle]